MIVFLVGRPTSLLAQCGWVVPHVTCLLEHGLVQAPRADQLPKPDIQTPPGAHSFQSCTFSLATDEAGRGWSVLGYANQFTMLSFLQYRLRLNGLVGLAMLFQISRGCSCCGCPAAVAVDETAQGYHIELEKRIVCPGCHTSESEHSE